MTTPTIELARDAAAGYVILDHAQAAAVARWMLAPDGAEADADSAAISAIALIHAVHSLAYGEYDDLYSLQAYLEEVQRAAGLVEAVRT